MLAIIALLIGITIAAAALVYAPRLVEQRVVFDATPDLPKPFGLRMSWLAIQSDDAARVATVLGLHDVKPANWNTGLGTVYAPDFEDTHVFIAPPVAGWILVAGIPLPHPVSRGFADRFTPLLSGLSNEFTDVQYFCAFPIIDLFAWARLTNGRMLRAFATGDEGVIVDRGKPTPEERTLGLTLFEVRGIKERKGDAGGPLILHPTEEHVMRLARAWSLDPMSLAAHNGVAATGLIGRAPSHWRTERLRKSA